MLCIEATSSKGITSTLMTSGASYATIVAVSLPASGLKYKQPIESNICTNIQESISRLQVFPDEMLSIFIIVEEKEAPLNTLRQITCERVTKQRNMRMSQIQWEVRRWYSCILRGHR